MAKKFLYVLGFVMLLALLTSSLATAGGIPPNFTIGNIESCSGGNNLVKVEKSGQSCQITIPDEDINNKAIFVPEGKVPTVAEGLVNAESPINIKARGNSISFYLSLNEDYNFVRMIDSAGRTVAALDETTQETLNQEGRYCAVKLSSRANYYVEIICESNGVVYDCYYVLLNIEAGKLDTFNNKSSRAAKLTESDYQAINAEYKKNVVSKPTENISSGTSKSSSALSKSSSSIKSRTSKKSPTEKIKKKINNNNSNILRRGLKGIF